MSTYPSAPPIQNRFLNVQIADVSTASSAWVVPGFRGRIKKLHCVIDTAITVADSAITVEINGTAVSGAVLTIESTGAAAGDLFSVTVPAGSTNRFDEGDAIEVISNGGSTTTSKATFTLELEPT
jgi:hypothetical protein